MKTDEQAVNEHPHKDKVLKLMKDSQKEYEKGRFARAESLYNSARCYAEAGGHNNLSSFERVFSKEN